MHDIVFFVSSEYDKCLTVFLSPQYAEYLIFILLDIWIVQYLCSVTDGSAMNPRLWNIILNLNDPGDHLPLDSLNVESCLHSHCFSTYTHHQSCIYISLSLMKMHHLPSLTYLYHHLLYWSCQGLTRTHIHLSLQTSQHPCFKILFLLVSISLLCSAEPVVGRTHSYQMSVIIPLTFKPALTGTLDVHTTAIDLDPSWGTHPII